MNEGIGTFKLDISDAEFAKMRTLIYDNFGINLTDQKKSLLISRLQKRILSSGLNSFDDYYQVLSKGDNDEEMSALIDLVSTNHTYFNRENDHYKFFVEEALPEIIERQRAKNDLDLRIWCAGCSYGQESYTLAMLLQEVLGAEYHKWKAGVLATDISSRALAHAMKGIYDDDQVGKAPEDLRKKYFRKSNEGWIVADKVRNEVTYRRFNLMNEVFQFKKPFHIIFCRNVMIYFDQPTREALVSRFHKTTEKDGFLFIGHSETLGRSQTEYKYLKPAVYKRN